MIEYCFVDNSHEFNYVEYVILVNKVDYLQLVKTFATNSTLNPYIPMCQTFR